MKIGKLLAAGAAVLTLAVGGTAASAATVTTKTTVTKVHGPMKILPHHNHKYCRTHWVHHKRVRKCWFH